MEKHLRSCGQYELNAPSALGSLGLGRMATVYASIVVPPPFNPHNAHEVAVLGDPDLLAFTEAIYEVRKQGGIDPPEDFFDTRDRILGLRGSGYHGDEPPERAWAALSVERYPTEATVLGYAALGPKTPPGTATLTEIGFLRSIVENATEDPDTAAAGYHTLMALQLETSLADLDARFPNSSEQQRKLTIISQAPSSVGALGMRALGLEYHRLDLEFRGEVAEVRSRAQAVIAKHTMQAGRPGVDVVEFTAYNDI